MLACTLGNSGEIFFPKFAKDELINFKDITLDFFKTMNQEVSLSASEEEAKKQASMRAGNDPYPVYFFSTDTSGEKLFEEFYTERDMVDLQSFDSLGVIKNALKSPLEIINQTLRELKAMMSTGDYNKAAIIKQLKSVIPDFEHVETGKNLDQKM